MKTTNYNNEPFFTYSIGSDSYAYAVVRQISPTRIEVQSMDSKQVGDYYNNQKWLHAFDDSRKTRVISYRTNKHGQEYWREMGSQTGYWRPSNKPESYRDPCF